MSDGIQTIQTITPSGGEIVLYQPDDTTSLEVQLEQNTVWLSQTQMVELFQTSKQNVSLHIGNIFKEGELQPELVVKESLTTTPHGAIPGKFQQKKVKLYNLDVIISLGYRVKSVRGTQFRIWATNVLRDHLLKGYSVNHQLIALQQHVDDRLLRIEDRLQQNEDQVAFLVHTHQQPQEELFATGCMWDAYSFISNLIRSAKEQVILIDNYCNDKTLTLLDQRAKDVKATIHTTYNNAYNEALEAHNNQQSPIQSIQLPHKIHDRFLIIDSQVYLLGNSLKDMGHTLSAAILTGFTPEEVLSKLK